ncbi:hypothetical protein [Flavobacterium undicola]|uniref:hypothetical protein n=1 Tax=Flavobacterium undicola TaxID=1932779 RepID=UPI001378ACC8|nr:hypothetical protein [Flavobacterium undicola]MBA0883037.1 hypothetical protein [Flavobacterium undicola]
MFFNVSFKTDFGYNNNDKQNGIKQNTPVVTPKTVDDVKKDKGDIWGNSSTILDIGAGIYGALETTATPGDQWLGKNGKYYNNSWGGNQYTGSRVGAFEAASNYKWAGRVALGAGIIISGVKTYNAYQLDGRHFGYNTQYTAISATGGIVGGWAGAEAGAATGAAIGVWFWGAGAVPGAIIGGFIGGFSGGYIGSSVGENSVNYYHNK